jgi:hypothetical protein
MSIRTVSGWKADASGSQSDSSHYAKRIAIHHSRISTWREEFSNSERIRQRTRILRRWIRILQDVLASENSDDVYPLMMTLSNLLTFCLNEKTKSLAKTICLLNLTATKDSRKQKILFFILIYWWFNEIFKDVVCVFLNLGYHSVKMNFILVTKIGAFTCWVNLSEWNKCCVLFFRDNQCVFNNCR